MQLLPEGSQDKSPQKSYTRSMLSFKISPPLRLEIYVAVCGAAEGVNSN